MLFNSTVSRPNGDTRLKVRVNVGYYKLTLQWKPISNTGRHLPYGIITPSVRPTCHPDGYGKAAILFIEMGQD